MLSKKLLSIILNKNILKIFYTKESLRNIFIRENDILFEYENNLEGSSYLSKNPINVYELMNKCKIWALKEGYCLMSCIHDNGSYEKEYSVCEVLKPIYGSSSLFDQLYQTPSATTEYEAVFKACEWILENK